MLSAISLGMMARYFVKRKTMAISVGILLSLFVLSLFLPKAKKFLPGLFVMKKHSGGAGPENFDVYPSETKGDEQLRVPWTWECKHMASFRTPGMYCIRELTSSFAEASSFQECSLTCTEGRSFWPLPRNITHLGTTVVEFSPNKVALSVDTDSVSDQDHRVDVVRHYLRTAGKLFLKDVKRYDVRRKLIRKKLPVVVQITLAVNSAIVHLGLGVDESYSLSVSRQGDRVRVKIDAATVYGARHGLETLSQVMDYDPYRQAFIMLDSVQLTDRPSFPYRGLMIDTARTFIPVPTLKSVVDAMSWNKMNVLHLHLTDSQNFPLDLANVEQLADFSAYSATDGVYEVTELSQLVAYAKLRGVKVVPEVDAPGHVGSGWEWSGDAILCNNLLHQGSWTSYCVEPPCGFLNPASKMMFRTLRKVYKTVLETFDHDLIHMGGDEVRFTCWNNTPEISDFMKSIRLNSSFEGFLTLWGDHFQKPAMELVEELNFGKPGVNKTDAILWTNSLTEVKTIRKFLPPEKYIIQVWDHSTGETGAELMKLGYRVIFSNYNSLYLDCGYASWLANKPFWCADYLPWYKLYDFEPKVESGKHKGANLGAEACMWTETTSVNALEAKIWPRLAGLAERLWTNPSRDSFYAWDRVNLQAERLALRGVKGDQLQPKWCLLNPGVCYDSR
ncbi:unnamed protein product [Notodromas monacha]|uniref:Beta-hexosaminidase n=1 Tax=Notodromas monacha TaxID=399045 RepID=A0A7R9BTP9_9CRUS|nr:unnamed protein product [Notodromas monacha]CAG0920496.1 unnamed protein product [Notodromas monacha]